MVESQLLESLQSLEAELLADVENIRQARETIAGVIRRNGRIADASPPRVGDILRRAGREAAHTQNGQHGAATPPTMETKAEPPKRTPAAVPTSKDVEDLIYRRLIARPDDRFSINDCAALVMEEYGRSVVKKITKAPIYHYIRYRLRSMTRAGRIREYAKINGQLRYCALAGSTPTTADKQMQAPEPDTVVASSTPTGVQTKPLTDVLLDLMRTEAKGMDNAKLGPQIADILQERYTYRSNATNLRVLVCNYLSALRRRGQIKHLAGAGYFI